MHRRGHRAAARGIQTRELSQLLFQIADQPLDPLFGKLVKGLFREPSGLRQPSLQFLSIALLGHKDMTGKCSNGSI
jgi:hypothetical protein